MEWVQRKAQAPSFENGQMITTPKVPPATWREWDEFFERLALTDPGRYNRTVIKNPGKVSWCVASGFARQTDRHNPAYRAWCDNAVRYAKKHKLGKYSGK